MAISYGDSYVVLAPYIHAVDAMCGGVQGNGLRGGVIGARRRH